MPEENKSRFFFFTNYEIIVDRHPHVVVYALTLVVQHNNIIKLAKGGEKNIITYVAFNVRSDWIAGRV